MIQIAHGRRMRSSSPGRTWQSFSSNEGFTKCFSMVSRWHASAFSRGSRAAAFSEGRKPCGGKFGTLLDSNGSQSLRGYARGVRS